MNFKQLKLLALCCMVFDHVTRIFPPSEALLPLAAALETAGHLDAALWLLEDVPLLLAYIGRLAAPIFLFCAANGFAHTHDIRAYCRRILLTALLAQLPYTLFDLAEQRLYGLTGNWRGTNLNILFTLFLGLAALWAWERLSAAGRRPLAYLAVAAAALLAHLLHTEGREGYILLIFVFYQTRGLSRPRRALWLLPATALSRWNLIRWAVTAATSTAVANCVLNAFGNYLGALVTLAYNGEKGNAGRRSQWFFYVFYPAHFALLALIGWLRPPI